MCVQSLPLRSAGQPSLPRSHAGDIPPAEGQHRLPECGGHGYLLFIRDLKVAGGDAVQSVQLPAILPQGNAGGVWPEQQLRYFDGAVKCDILELIYHNVPHGGVKFQLSQGGGGRL